jgi:[acyl-carrier-protein] S-malonyltransferase
MLQFPATDLSRAALAFRGYNITNLGRTAELLAVPTYRPILEHELARFGDICSEVVGRPVDLKSRVVDSREPGLEAYAESVALIVAIEVAQLRILQEIHGVDTTRTAFSFGYSLGELVAVSCAGIFAPDHMIRVPLAMAADSVALAHDVTMGVLFSRGPSIALSQVERLCEDITSEGQGTIGVSSILSPNTYLLLGQRETIDRFRQLMKQRLPHRAQLRINEHRWPPLHTAIARQRNIPDRAAVMMETLPGGYGGLSTQVFSLVTGSLSYKTTSARAILRQWVDHPQRLWDAIDYCLAEGIETVIHVGPEPNLIPATFNRLSENVQQETEGKSLASMGLRAVSGIARHPWLAGILPARTNLLRAPYVKHVILEDWLLGNAPAAKS